MNTSKLLKKLMLELDITQAELAKKLGQSQPNMSRKIIANDFRINDFERIVNSLDCQLVINIVLPNGKVIN